jgi:hypothetical protein
MKKLYPYDKFISEGLRDKMTPKSETDIIKSVSDMSATKKIFKGIQQNMPIIVKLGIKDGADVNKENIGVTPLESAICFHEIYHNDNSIEIIEMLLKAGADINKEIVFPNSYKQRNSLDVAKGKKLYDVVELIKKYNKIDEGVKNLMTPRSIEDIMSTLDSSPKNIFKTMKKIGVEEDKLYSYIYKSLPKEKIRDVFLDYISENKEKLHSTNLNIFVDILKKLEELISLMNENHNSEAEVSLNMDYNKVWDEVTLRLYEELTDEQMKEVVKKAIKNEKI